MKQKNTRKQQPKGLKILPILIIVLTILAIVQIVGLVNKNKINKVNTTVGQAVGDVQTNIGNQYFDISSKIADKALDPVISAGMIPIKYTDTGWEVTSTSDSNWYDYNNHKPAYIMLNNNKYSSELMAGKEIAVAGTKLQTNEMGKIFTWVPRLTYSSLNARNNVYYLGDRCIVAGEYVTSELFTYAGSGINGQDIALKGFWVEQSGTLSSTTISSFNKETNTYGFIGNIHASSVKLDEQFVVAINTIKEDIIKNTDKSRAVIQVVDERVLEPIMGTVTVKGISVTVDVTKAENEVEKVVAEIVNVEGQASVDNVSLIELTKKDNNKYTMKAEVTGTYRFVIIDKAGNQREYKKNVVIPKIEIITNKDNYVEYKGEKWYPYGTEVRITFSDTLYGITPYSQRINGTTGEAIENWQQSTTIQKTITLTETTKVKAKLENEFKDVEIEIAETIHIMPNDKLALVESYKNNIGGMYPVKITSTTTASNQKGTENYAYNTYISTAAKHMGITGDVVYIKITPSPQGGYVGSTRNGITTVAQSTNANGYIFIKANDEEIKLPKISRVLPEEEDTKIKVTVDAESYNTDESGNKKIQTYYYSIDGKEYVAKAENTHTFENVDAYRNHEIKVYVVDSYGMVSNVTTISSKTTTALPIPQIEIKNKDTIQTVEYGDKEWYPYNTVLKIGYVKEISEAERQNLTVLYKSKNVTTNVESDWQEIANNGKEIEIPLTESIKYYAKIRDITGEETGITEIENLYIMPGETLQANYANYTVGEIYPVVVTKNTTGPIYGTDTYSYDTNIGTALTHLGYKDGGEVHYIKVVQEPSKGYTSTLKNGITSLEGTGKNGYTFVTAGGEEIKSPQITRLSTASALNSITATIGQVIYYNNTSFEKYYYQIDDEPVIEIEDEEEKVREFSNIKAYQKHKIQVYVVAQNGTRSKTIEVTTTTTNELPTPKMEIVNESSLDTVEYNSKVWYPYGTQLKMYYEGDATDTDISNLKICYKSKNITTGQESDWIEVSAKEQVVTLTESMIYYVRIKDASSEETETINKEMYIMPGTTLQPNYATNLNSIYPVRVTGSTEGTIYGLGVYHYNSYIAKAAMHMGLATTTSTTTLYIKVTKPNDTYYKAYTNQNNITSTQLISTDNGYVFVTEAGEEQAPLPVISSMSLVQSGDNKVATVTASSNGASISAYYYSVNGGGYVSGGASYSFGSIGTEVVSVSAYVLDSNGNRSLFYVSSIGSSSASLKYSAWDGTVSSGCGNGSWSVASKSYMDGKWFCSNYKHRQFASSYLDLSNYLGLTVTLSFDYSISALKTTSSSNSYSGCVLLEVPGLGDPGSRWAWAYASSKNRRTESLGHV